MIIINKILINLNSIEIRKYKNLENKIEISQIIIKISTNYKYYEICMLRFNQLKISLKTINRIINSK